MNEWFWPENVIGFSNPLQTWAKAKDELLQQEDFPAHIPGYRRISELHFPVTLESWYCRHHDCRSQLLFITVYAQMAFTWCFGF